MRSRHDPLWDEQFVGLVVLGLFCLLLVLIAALTFTDGQGGTPTPGPGEVCGWARHGKTSSIQCVTTTEAGR